MARRKFKFPITTLAGTTLSNFLAICRKHRIGSAFYPKLALSFLIAAFLEPFNLWERIILGKKLKACGMKEPPVFIIGFWRSGTTLLHNLLCSDPKAGYTTTFQVVFPNVAITQAWWLKRISARGLPENRPFDNVRMNMNFPQEEESGMAILQPDSLYNCFLFPAEFDRIMKEEFFTELLPPAQLGIWKQQYLGLVNKAMLNTGGTRYISKNPCHLGRLKLISSMFPGARFIYIYRNPYQVVESLYQFYLLIIPGIRLQNLQPGFSRKDIANFYSTVIRNYLLTRSVIPPKDLLEIRMEDFMEDKLGYMKMIYEKFNLGSFEQVNPCFEKCLTVNGRPAGLNYDIPLETIELVNDCAPDILHKFGYRKIE